MVYRGKPSKGCSRCREKKTRCDQRPEGCSNCQNLGLICPGYRNQLDLMFCYEQPVKLKRAKAKAEASRKKHAASSHDTSETLTSQKTDPGQSRTPSASSSVDLIATRSPSLPRPRTAITTSSRPTPMHFVYDPGRAPHVPLRDKALGYFFTDYVPGDQSRVAERAISAHADLLPAMTLLGVAGLARLYRSADLKTMAAALYGDAIRHLNTALRLPETAKRDSTLLSIHILTYYEAETGASRKSFEAWQTHINGAAALLDMRGPEQFLSPSGRTLFVQTVFNLTGVCIHQFVPLPHSLFLMLSQAEAHLHDPENPVLHQLHIIWRLAELNSAVHHKRITDIDTIIMRTLELDIELADAIDRIGQLPGWGHAVEELDNSFLPDLPAYRQIFEHFLPSQQINFARVSRMALNGIIFRTLRRSVSAPLSDVHQDLLTQTRAIILDLQQDILASIPQYLGMTYMPSFGLGGSSKNAKQPAPLSLWSAWGSNDLVTPLAQQGDSPPDLPTLRLAGGNGVILLLSAVGNTPLTTPALRRWIVDTLMYIGEEVGIKQALVVAQAVRSKG